MKIVVHALEHGQPLCRFSRDIPVNWPDGHTWISVQDRQHVKNVTCLSCAQMLKNTLCDHRLFLPRIHGRVCPCGKVMIP